MRLVGRIDPRTATSEYKPLATRTIGLVARAGWEDVAVDCPDAADCALEMICSTGLGMVRDFDTVGVTGLDARFSRSASMSARVIFCGDDKYSLTTLIVSAPACRGNRTRNFFAAVMTSISAGYSASSMVRRIVGDDSAARLRSAESV